jgi:hypothetical protein
MRRRLFDCSSCGRRFKNSQALFGHLRQCQYHRLKRQAKAKAENPPPGKLQPKQNGSKRFVERNESEPLNGRYSRDSQENLLLLLDVYEVLPELKRKCLDYAAIGRLLGSVKTEMTPAEEWVSLYWIIDECERDYEQMVMRFRLDRMILFQFYRQMLVVKKCWLNYLSNDFDKETGPLSEEIHEKETSALYEEEKIWNTIMTSTKKMLAASH